MRAIPGLVFAVFAAGCSVGEPTPVPIVDPAYHLRAVDQQGLAAVLKTYRGKGLLVNVWSSTWAPCKRELPHLLEVARRYRANGGRLLGVSYDLMETNDAARAKARVARVFENPRIAAFTTLLYDADDYEGINGLLGLPGGMPQTVAIDADGEIVDHQDGAADEARFDEMMRKALRR